MYVVLWIIHKRTCWIWGVACHERGEKSYPTLDHNTALNNNEINSNLNNKISETAYTAITESRLRVAKIISQMMPNLAKVYLENT